MFVKWDMHLFLPENPKARKVSIQKHKLESHCARAGMGSTASSKMAATRRPQNLDALPRSLLSVIGAMLSRRGWHSFTCSSREMAAASVAAFRFAAVAVEADVAENPHVSLWRMRRVRSLCVDGAAHWPQPSTELIKRIVIAMPVLQSLSLNMILNEEDLVFVAALRHLEELCLVRSVVRVASLRKLTNLRALAIGGGSRIFCETTLPPNLRSLTASAVAADDLDRSLPRLLQTLPLTQLSIVDNLAVDEHIIKQIQTGCKGLRHLGCHLMNSVATLPLLESLHVGAGGFVSALAQSAWMQLPSLQCVGYASSMSVDLPASASLTSLGLTSLRYSVSFPAFLPHLPLAACHVRLRHLTLQGPCTLPPNNKFFYPLALLPALEHLAILRFNGIHSLPPYALPTLTSLQLSHMRQLSSEGLRLIPTLSPHLRALDVVGCSYLSVAHLVAAVARLPRLEQLLFTRPRLLDTRAILASFPPQSIVRTTPAIFGSSFASRDSPMKSSAICLAFA